MGVLKYPDFRKLWLSQVFSQVALNMVTFALVLHIFELTNKATSISLVMIATALPVALFGPFSGVLADKFNRKRILLYTNILRIGAVLLLIASAHNVLGILEIIFIVSALSQIFAPAESSLIPQVVPKEKIIAANSTVMTTSYATLLVGYSIAGPLLILLHPDLLFLLCGVLYVLASWSVFRLTDHDISRRKSISLEYVAKGIERVWQEIKISFKDITEDKKIFKPMVKLTIGWIALGAFITLLPAFSESVLHISAKLIGPIIIAPAGIGMFIAASILNRKKKANYNKAINFGFLIVGLSLLVFAFFRYYDFGWIQWLIVISSLLIIGLGTGIVQITAQTLLHLNSTEEKRGRVFGYSTMQLKLATSLPALFVGGLSDLTSPFLTMLLLAILVVIYAIILLVE